MSNKKLLYLGLDPYRCKTSKEIIFYPIIQIRPLLTAEVESCFNNFESYTHLLITSRAAASLCLAHLQRLQKRIACKIIAIGQATAQLLEERGYSAFAVAKSECAEGIIELLETLSLESAHLFFPHSSLSRTLISSYLAEKAIQHTSVILYETLPHLPEPLPNFAEVDEIFFTSPSTVEAFLTFFHAFPQHTLLTAIGPVTQKHLEEKRG